MEVDFENLTEETAPGERGHCESCYSKAFEEWRFAECRNCTRRCLAYQAMCITCAKEWKRCCSCTKRLIAAPAAPEGADDAVSVAGSAAAPEPQSEEVQQDMEALSLAEEAEKEAEDVESPISLLVKVRNASYFYNDLTSPDPLKLPASVLPPLKAIIAAANKGDTAALARALGSAELREAGGLPRDLFAWLPMPTWLDYDGEDGELSRKFLKVVRMLVEHGAAVSEEELLPACARFGLTGLPDIRSNASLNRVLDWACQYGFVPVFRYLHERGGNGRMLIGDTCGEGRLEMLRYMLRAKLLPSPAESEMEGTLENTMVSEAFSCADMSGQKRVIDFLVEEAGYSRKRFKDHGERHEPMD